MSVEGTVAGILASMFLSSVACLLHEVHSLLHVRPFKLNLGFCYLLRKDFYLDDNFISKSYSFILAVPYLSLFYESFKQKSKKIGPHKLPTIGIFENYL